MLTWQFSMENQLSTSPYPRNFNWSLCFAVVSYLTHPTWIHMDIGIWPTVVYKNRTGEFGQRFLDISSHPVVVWVSRHAWSWGIPKWAPQRYAKPQGDEATTAERLTMVYGRCIYSYWFHHHCFTNIYRKHSKTTDHDLYYVGLQWCRGNTNVIIVVSTIHVSIGGHILLISGTNVIWCDLMDTSGTNYHDNTLVFRC